MDSEKANKQSKNKKIAYIVGTLALILYVASMFAMWKQ
jgi:hypothetical protein